MAQLMRREPVFSPVDRLFGTLLSRDPFFAPYTNGSHARDWADEEGTLALDISDDGEHVVVEASLPGYSREDIAVEIKEGVLTINARQEEMSDDEGEDNGVRYVRRERRVGTVSRRVALPAAVDQDRAEATLADGVLTLRLPKVDREAPRRIEIN